MNQWSELEDKIKELAETEPVPESVSPESMKQKLEENKSVKRHNKKINYVRFGSMAAALLIVFVLSVAAIRENHITKNDDYEGEIIASEDKTEAAAEGSNTQSQVTEVLNSETSYDKIYSKIKAVQEMKRTNEMNYSADGIILGSSESVNFTSSTTLKDNVKLESSMEKEDYSTTNLQEQGVGEADTVITDGEYFYIQKDGESVVKIVKVDGEQMETVSEISVGKFSQEEEQYLHEFYVAGNKLFLMTSRYEFNNNTSKEETIVITYDISDKANPKEISRLSQSGSYYSSRMTDGYLYVFSDYYVYDEIEKENPGTFVPLVSGEAIGCEDIFIPEEVDNCQYKVITSIDVEKPDCFVENRSVLCGSGIVYVSTHNIYFTTYHSTYDTDEEYDYTEIWKFTYNKGSIVGTASGKVKGNITDQFALHESNGYLRVVTTYQKRVKYEEETIVEGNEIAKLDVLVSTSEDEKNGLYVFDSALKQVGAIEDLAPDESIYSARFFEKTAYFVTFRQTDPLFSVDLSDPANPKLLGELKIPGFSEYLHPYGDGLLLGIGYDADEDGVRTGIKLTMFDVSDPVNVKELTTYSVAEFGRNNGWAGSDAMGDHKQILVDVEKNIIGFSYEKIDYGNYGYGYEDVNKYVVYGFDKENGFYEKMNTTYNCANNGNMTEEQRDNLEKKRGTLRGLYIDKYFYTVNQSLEICCYDMEQQFKLLDRYEY